MRRLEPRARSTVLGVKVAGLVVGVAAILLALQLAFDEFTHLSIVGGVLVGDVVSFLSMVVLAFAGAALIAQLPESFRARFRVSPKQAKRRPVYGFGTMVAVGVGATLGSPLFILIPLNIEQYEIVSLLSLVIASVFSIAMAKVYSDLGRNLKLQGAELVGSPSFVRASSGAKSVRYFVSRVSMWIANTALAAYTKIVFLIFDFVFMPQILASSGVGSLEATLVVWVIAIAFVGWTIVNIFFEQKYLKALGAIQIVLTSILVVMIAYHSTVLGFSGGWNLSGFLGVPSGVAWLPALVINTGYLYLLFFGFQEIQVFERDSMERSPIPVISWLRKGYTLDKSSYFEAAMIVSVVVASMLNIFYGVAVFSAGHLLPGLDTSCATSSCIPALYLTQNLLGGWEVVLVGVAFLIATVTTFVPAFLAAARHLGALGEDGYMPTSLASLSWLFTLVAIFLLAIGDQNFLVDITDVMVLISLGIIALAGLSRKRGSKDGGGSRTLALLVGLACFLFGGAIYFVPGGGSVVVFGTVAIIFAYLIFDIIELGALGAQLFISVFGFVSVVALSTFGHVVYAGGTLVGLSQLLGLEPDGILFWALLVSSALLAANVYFDVRVLRRTSVR